MGLSRISFTANRALVHCRTEEAAHELAENLSSRGLADPTTVMHIQGNKAVFGFSIDHRPGNIPRDQVAGAYLDALLLTDGPIRDAIAPQIHRAVAASAAHEAMHGRRDVQHASLDAARHVTHAVATNAPSVARA